MADTSWIQTHTGRQFWPLAPRIKDVAIEDIAHALANLCRFTGHTRIFYSVAEHSVRVSHAAERAALPELAASAARVGLLHDGSEAYLADIASPVKYSPEFAFYREAEARLQDVIYARFGIVKPELSAVIFADRLLLATERAELLSPSPADWGIVLPEPMDRQGLGWDPMFAESMFLARFRELFG